jgi:hypothetical protein
MYKNRGLILIPEKSIFRHVYSVVVEYLTSSPVNDTHRHYKREYFII